jgi:F-type H+-transporting ATPase subunit delta
VVADLSLISGLAGRYANALFGLARDQKVLDEVDRDLVGLATLIDESADFARLIRNPILSREEQGRAVAAVLERAGTIDLVRRFVGLLARNRRLFILAQVVRLYRALLAEHRGEVGADVTSARALSAAQIDALKANLSRAAGREVNVTSHVDEGGRRHCPRPRSGQRAGR